MVYVTESKQKRLDVNVHSMLEDEVGWLTNFVPSDGAGVRDTDNTLLAGHLRLIRTLLTCQAINKVINKVEFGTSTNATYLFS